MQKNQSNPVNYQVKSSQGKSDTKKNRKSDSVNEKNIEKDLTVSSKKYSIITQNISAAYNNNSPVLKDINLKLPGGKLTSIIGPNGAGKSTLFYLLVGIKQPKQGTVSIFGESIKSQKRKNNIAYVPQQEKIERDYPIKVWNVVLGGRYGHMKSTSGWKKFLPPGWADSRHKKIVKEALKTVNMYCKRKQPLGNLSGGQQKRVFLARALAQKAKLLLLDEPLTGIDHNSKKLILNVLQDIKNQGRTVIMITHNLSEVLNHADHLILLNQKVVATGSPEEISKQNNLRDLF